MFFLQVERMAGKHEREPDEYHNIQLACGEWIEYPLNYDGYHTDEQYEEHRLECLLCAKTRKLENHDDIRYDVLLSCGTRGIIRVLTEEQYNQHRKACRKCGVYPFHFLKSVLCELTEQLKYITDSLKLCKDDMISMLHTLMNLQIQVGNSQPDLMHTIQTMFSTYSQLLNLNDYSVTQPVVKSCQVGTFEEKLAQIQERLALEKEKKYRLTAERILIQDAIVELAGSNVYSLTKRLFTENDTFRYNKKNTVVCVNTTAFEEFHTVTEKDEILIGWKHKSTKQHNYFRCNQTLWRCFLRTFFLVQEKNFNREVEKCLLKFPDALIALMHDFLVFSSFQLLNCLYEFFCQIQTSVTQDITECVNEYLKDLLVQDI